VAHDFKTDEPLEIFPLSLQLAYSDWVLALLQMRLGSVALLSVLALSTAGVAGAAPPGASTGPVSAIGPTSATAGGTVNPRGLTTSWYVEYGTTTAYGKKTTTRNAGSGTADVPVSAGLTGLAPGTTYHYRLVATNTDGTVRGADGIFTTLSTPAAVTGSASGITTTSARLAGTVDPNGRATSWYFEYGTGTGYGSRTATGNAGSGTTARSVSATVSSLGSGRVYHYRLVAVSDAGTSRGADRTFATAGPPLVQTGAALDVGPSSARATGSVNPQGRQTSWYVEYGTTTRYGSRTSGRSAGSGFGTRAVSVSLSRLLTGAVYHYRLVATNNVGTTRGADLTFATTGVSIAARAQSVVYGRGVLLSGAVPTARPNETVTVYAQRFGAGSPTAVATVLTGAGGAWSYVARPRISTSYLAGWGGATSRATRIGVRPAITLSRVGPARFRTRVFAARSFARRFVKLQRLTLNRGWVTVKRVRLGRRSGATFRVQLRRGTSRLRVVMSVNQAGRGYLAGISRPIVYRRR
jgi:hypothetical protein